MSQSTSAAPTIAQRPWALLQKEAAACTRCHLHDSRTHVVFGEGDPDADLLFVGEAPGRPEDLQGRPFAGAVGNLLTNLLLENGLRRTDVYLCNVVKCRPPLHREPFAEEIEACSPYLREQLLHVSPRVIVTLGALATRLLLGKSVPVAKVAGYRFDAFGATLVPTYHPAEALRGSPQAMTALRRDVRIAKGVLEGRIAPAREALAELRAGRGTASR